MSDTLSDARFKSLAATRWRFQNPSPPMDDALRLQLAAVLYDCRWETFQRQGANSERFKAICEALRALKADKHPLPWSHISVDVYGDRGLRDATGFPIDSIVIPDSATADTIMERCATMSPADMQANFGINVNWE